MDGSGGLGRRRGPYWLAAMDVKSSNNPGLSPELIAGALAVRAVCGHLRAAWRRARDLFLFGTAAVALYIMRNPPRAEAPNAMRACRAAVP
eukprot:CAMPEP_0170258496 /NCGR_PEP_ID=MMETSP0116_2-20130129/29114_1 /TAXON_ID=400756 /ORGANISM="Durinskia baltica, Strain CSIRO CS-38" /LENGTH=90 /DNA_ID=CAMNT_0010509531 /DNA_START=121 /DNA_END=394 /DNA_ORIENTATION=-